MVLNGLMWDNRSHAYMLRVYYEYTCHQNQSVCAVTILVD